MSKYLDRSDDLLQDTKNFLASEYGKHIVSTLEETAKGYLARASDTEAPYPERYAAKYSAFKEVLDLINSPLS